MNKFEQLMEYVINDEESKARELSMISSWRKVVRFMKT